MKRILWEFFKLWVKILTGRMLGRTSSHDEWRNWIKTQSQKSEAQFGWCWKVTAKLIGSGRPK